MQEIYVVHNPELKAGAQCAHRKTQYQNKNKTKTNKTHHNYHRMDDRTIIQSTTARKVDSPETTDCTSVHKHVIK